jgi:hypothetical protein
VEEKRPMMEHDLRKIWINITTSSKTETEIAKSSESFEMEVRKIRGSEHLPPESLIPACGNKAFP